MELICRENEQFLSATDDSSERRPVRAGCDPVLTGDNRVWRNLTSLEKNHTISESYFSTIQRDVQPYMRRILTVWMLQVRLNIIRLGKKEVILKLKKTSSPTGLYCTPAAL